MGSILLTELLSNFQEYKIDLITRNLKNKYKNLINKIY